jgi:hypothetical protein
MIPEKLAVWAQQPNAVVSPAEMAFLAAIREARAGYVGYGWMQQVIEWAWQEESGEGAWGPEYFGKQIAQLEAELAAVRAQLPTQT